MVILNINYTRFQHHLIKAKKKWFSIGAVDDKTDVFDDPRQPNDDIILWLPHLFPDIYSRFSYNDILEHYMIESCIQRDIRAFGRKYKRVK